MVALKSRDIINKVSQTMIQTVKHEQKSKHRAQKLVVEFRGGNRRGESTFPDLMKVMGNEKSELTKIRRSMINDNGKQIM
jgi:hypothetical protein